MLHGTNHADRYSKIVHHYSLGEMSDCRFLDPARRSIPAYVGLWVQW